MNPQQGQQSGGGNPFAAILAQMQNKGGMGPQPQQGANPMLSRAIAQPQAQQAMNIPPGMQGGAGGGAAKAQMPSNVPGSNPGSTDSLIKALGALNSVIASTDDQGEIQQVRQIILMIQKLIQMDQQKQGQKESALGQAQQGAQRQALPAPMGGGQPSGNVPMR